VLAPRTEFENKLALAAAIAATSTPKLPCVQSSAGVIRAGWQKSDLKSPLWLQQAAATF